MRYHFGEMSFVRILVAWLILAALPLQGFAAASMMLCDHAGGAAAHQGHTAHAHADHHADGHAEHSSSGSDGHHAQPTVDVDAASTAQSPHDHTDACEHACSLCASCHVTGLARFDGLPIPPDPASAELPQPVQTVLTRAAPLPDKPPRA